MDRIREGKMRIGNSMGVVGNALEYVRYSPAARLSMCKVRQANINHHSTHLSPDPGEKISLLILYFRVRAFKRSRK